GEVLAVLKAREIELEHFRVRPADLARLLDMVRDGLLSNTAAKKVFSLMVESGDQPEKIATAEGLIQVSDDSALEGWVGEAIAKHSDEWARFVAGERKLTG